MRADQLPELPVDVKHAVNDGLHSLYEIPPQAGATYVLVTGAREIFPLSATGSYVHVKISLEELKPIRAVHFDGLPTRDMKVLELNYSRH